MHGKWIHIVYPTPHFMFLGNLELWSHIVHIFESGTINRIPAICVCTSINGIPIFVISLLVGDVVQWTTMLLGYTEHNKNENVIQFYPQMLVQGFLLPNMMAFFSMLKECGNMEELVVHMKMKLDFVMDGGVAYRLASIVAQSL